jgi:hypothetical protein
MANLSITGPGTPFLIAPHHGRTLGDFASFNSCISCLQDENSLFTALVDNSGKNAAKLLKEMAQAAYEKVQG